MGEIVFWGIIRSAVLLPVLWITFGVVEYKYWWPLLGISIYGIIIHPAVIQYRLFQEKNKDILNNTLCSSCKNFDESAILCTMHDKHPTVDQLPCEGLNWELKEKKYEEETYS